MFPKSNRQIVMFVCLILVVFCGECFAKKFNDKAFEFFEWTNPTPRFADLGFDLDEVSKIVDDSQMLISHKGKSIDLWTRTGDTTGKVRHYDNVRFVTSISIFEKSRKELVDYYMDFERYSDVMEQITVANVIKSEKNQHLVRLKQEYKVTILSLVADFRYLYTQEENGDLSVLLIDGDVGAGVNRTEFIALDENRTLVAVTQWIDLDSAKFLYRTMIKAQPDIKPTAPLAASAMLAEQFRDYLNKQKGACDTPKDVKVLPEEPTIPVYATGSISADTLRRLSDLGTLIFVHPSQWIQTEKGPQRVTFVSAAGQLPGRIEQAKPLSSDFARFSEYFDQARKVEYRKGENGTIIDWYFKFGFGAFGVGMNYTINADWQNENTVFFEGIAGDIDPLHGAWEWIDLKKDNTLVVFTAAMRIGDDAPWIVKLGRKVPRMDLIGPIFMGTLIIEKQADWIAPQLKDMDSHSVALNY